MNYRKLGKWGIQVSELSLGSWLTFGKQISDDTAKELMVTAYDNGVNFFDNAEIYARGKSEEVMGKILKDTGWGRDTYVVSTKVFWGGDKPNQTGLSRKHIMEGINNSLRRLQLDYVDLFFCHRPDPETPIEETVFAMNDVIRQGKAYYWGTSEWSAQQITEAHLVARQYGLIPPAMEQPQYNMVTRQRFELEYAPLYKEFGMGTTIWSPLASGLLTGKYNQGAPQEQTRLSMEGLDWLRDRVIGENDIAQQNIDKVKQLTTLAQELGISTTHLALAWCLKNPHVSTVITGASKVTHLVDNLKAANAVPLLTNEVMEKIESILNNKPNLANPR